MLIEENECYSYQLAMNNSFDRSLYFPGFVYDVRWIEACIRAKKLVKPNDYQLTKLAPSAAGRHIDFQNTRPLYTIREAIYLFENIDAKDDALEKYQTHRGL